jgi:hypothetical protein
MATDVARYDWRPVESEFAVVLERSGEDSPVLALGFYARPLPANPGHLLVWRPERRALRISVFELDRLLPLAQTDWPSEVPIGHARRLVSQAPPVEELAIREGLGAGLHRHHVYRSQHAADLDEVLLLGNGPARSPAAASIYSWRPRRGQVEVLPLTWFTDEDFDLGYEWCPRVVRDPVTRRIAGDGIRMSRFVLSEDGKRLSE